MAGRLAVRLTALMLAALMAAGLLAGCGKKGAPVAPGPREEIISGKGYPSR